MSFGAAAWINLVFLMTLPSACGLIILGEPIIRLLYSHGGAFKEADVVPPEVSLAWPAVFAQMTKPVQWVFKRIKDAKTRAEVEAMYREFQETGKVIDTLPADDRAVRTLHAKEVLKVSLKTLDAEPIPPIGTKHGSLESLEPPTLNKTPAAPPPKVRLPVEKILVPQRIVEETPVERPLPAIVPRTERPAPPPRPVANPQPIPRPC